LDNLLSQSPDQQQTLAAIGEVPIKTVPEKEAELYLYVVLTLKNSSFLWQDLFAISQDQPFRFPSTFTFVIRAFSTLEGAYSICSFIFFL